jgi:hypothetical protein
MKYIFILYIFDTIDVDIFLIFDRSIKTLNLAKIFATRYIFVG